MMKSLICMLALLFAASALADSEAVALIDTYYANFEQAADGQTSLEDLLAEAEKACPESSQAAEAWLACGLIRAAYAKQEGGLHGLSQLKQARKELEISIDLDHVALQAYAAAFLGRLYATVPRWPLAFGSDAKARAQFQRSITAASEGRAGNYYYGLFLVDKKEADSAREHLSLARDATLPCHCPAWQSVLQRDIRLQLKSLDDADH